MDEIIPFLRKAFSGKPFEYQGREVVVTPAPDTVPMLIMGGSTHAAARRAARDADYFIPSLPAVYETYREELVRLGKPDMGPSARQPATVYFVAENPDAYWQQLAPHAMHEQNSYAEWAEKSGIPSPYAFYSDADSLRQSGKYTVLTAAEMAELFSGLHEAEPMILSPLVGGLDPELSWQSLRLFEEQVLPHIAESGSDVFKT